MAQNNLDHAVAALEKDMVATLQAWLRIPSVKADPKPNAPFGEAIRQSLDLAVADGKRLGFATRDIDGYACDMEIGSGDDAIAILAHLDVVPAGEGWQQQPFGADIIDGKIYGRGTSDDKGPAVAAMFAMKAIVDAGIPLKKKVRLILGCDEESGWADMKYYQQKIGLPRVGFSPDAEFPLINTEKGICHLTLTAKLAPEGNCHVPVYAMHSGERANVIPGVAEAEIGGDAQWVTEEIQAFSRRTGYPLTVEPMDNGHLRVVCTGVTGHASMPEHGENAAAHLLQALHAIKAGGTSYGIIDMLAHAIGGDTDGSGFGIAGSDAVSGALTINLGILRFGEGTCSVTLDIRHPVMFSAEQLIRFITLRVAPLGFTVAPGHCQPAHHVPESSQVVQSLLSVYARVSGLEPKAMAIGGGTYARALEEGVAFGSVFPGEEELAHQAGENISIASLLLNARIFAHAIVALAGE